MHLWLWRRRLCRCVVAGVRVAGAAAVEGCSPRLCSLGHRRCRGAPQQVLMQESLLFHAHHLGEKIKLPVPAHACIAPWGMRTMRAQPLGRQPWSK